MNEVWKDIPGYKKYQASSFGRIRSMDYRHTGIPKELVPCNNTDGYYFVSLFNDGKRKRCLVHRLVLSAFFGESQLQCNHKDGNKKNNFIENLEYCTCKENIIHAHKNGLARHYKRKIKCIETGIEYESIALASKTLSVHPSNIRDVLKGRQKRTKSLTFSYSTGGGI